MSMKQGVETVGVSDLDDEKEKSKYPKWIVNQDQCQWCKRYTMEITSITKEEEGLLVKYLCSNSDCDRLHRFGKQSDFAIMHGGKSIESYEKFTKENENG